MSNLPGTLFKNWNDGEVMHESEYEQERTLLITAINDNYARLAKSFIVQNADGSTKATQVLNTAVNSVKFREGTSIALTLDNATGVLTISATVDSGAITTDKLADGAVTTPKIALGSIGTQHLNAALFAAAANIATQLEFDNRMVSIKKYSNLAVGVDWTPAIQAAINEVNTTGGGIVYVPFGTYRCKNVQLKSNVTLAGSGHGSVLKLLDGSTIWDMVVGIGGTVPGQNCGVRDIKLDGNQQVIGLIDVQMHCLTIEGGSNNIRINNVWCANACGDGIWVVRDAGSGNPPGVIPTNVVITDCYFTGNQRQDISFVACKQAVFNNNRCMGNGLGAIDVEPEVNGDLQYLTISGNYAEFINVTTKNFKRAMVAITGNSCRKASIWEAGGVTFSGNTVFGLMSLQEVSDVIVEGNQLKGMYIQPQATTFNTRIQIINNMIINEDNGVSDPKLNVNNSGTPIYIWRTNDVRFSGNTIIVQDQHGIYVDGTCSDIKIENNRFLDTVKTSLTNYGVYKRNNAVGDVNFDVINNSIEGFHRGVRTDGSQKLTRGLIARNIINCRGKTLDLLDFDNAVVDGNISIGDVQIYLQFCINAIATRNVFRTTVDTAHLLELNGCTNSRVIDNHIFHDGNAETILIWNSKDVFVDNYMKNHNAIAVLGSSQTAKGSKLYASGTGPAKGVWAIGDEVPNSAPVSGGYRGWVCTAAGTANTFAWQTSLAYIVVGEQVNNGGKVYECIITGTSAASGGPTGTGADIVDGTVHWKYVDVKAVFNQYGLIV